MYCSASCIPAASDALVQCITVIIPSLFPFLVLTEILNNTDLFTFIGNKAEKTGKLLFNVSGNAFSIIIISYICGFPATSKITSDFYRNGKISYSDALRLSAFTNNPGPLFMIGTIGVGFLGSARTGAELYLIQITASLITGLIMNHFVIKSHENIYKVSVKISDTGRTLDLITSAISNSVTAMLPITGTIVFFTFLSEAIIDSGVLFSFLRLFSAEYSREYASGVIRCIFELTGGLTAIIPLYSGSDFLIHVISLICGWSGLAIHIQVSNFYLKENISVRFYFIGKILTSILAFLLALSIGLFN